MIDGRGRVRILDFGLAAPGRTLPTGRRSRARRRTWRPSSSIGSAPSVQSDIYALGLVLYEMFAGKPAFQAASVAEMARLHHESTPTSLSRILADADPASIASSSDVWRRIQTTGRHRRWRVGRAARRRSVGGGAGGRRDAVARNGRGCRRRRCAAADGRPGLFGGVLGLVIAVLVSARTQAIRYAPTEKAPAVLADQADR